MPHDRKYSTALLVATITALIASVLAGPALGSASTEAIASAVTDSATQQYTGCLTPLARIRRVAIGEAPSRPCTDAQVQITWNAEGPVGPKGDRGPRGRRGPVGPEGPPGEVPAATESTGGGQAVANMSPYLSLTCIIALQGIYPSRNDAPDSEPQAPSELAGPEPFIGEIAWFAGNFAPRGWARCDGQLLQIVEHQALYSILGTMYGGDGRVTFALPDMRGRSPVHVGAGPGLSTRSMGERGGAERTTIAESNLPPHVHLIVAP